MYIYICVCVRVCVIIYSIHLICVGMFLVSVPLSGCSLLCKMAHDFILPCAESGFVVRTRRGENEVKGTGGTVPWLWRWVLDIVPTLKKEQRRGVRQAVR